MSLKIGDKLALTIHDIAFGGDGVGRVHVTRDAGQVTSDGNSPATTAGESLSPDTCHPSPGSFVVFVPFVLVGETVAAEITEVKKNFARAKLLRVDSRRRSAWSRHAVISARAAAASISTLLTRRSCG